MTTTSAQITQAATCARRLASTRSGQRFWITAGQDLGLQFAIDGLHGLPPLGARPSNPASFRRARNNMGFRLVGRRPEDIRDLAVRSALGVRQP